MHLIPTKTKNSETNGQNTKMEVELDERALKIIDGYVDEFDEKELKILDERIGSDDKTNYRPRAINSIIISYGFINELFEAQSEYNLHCDEYDDKLHNEIKRYQDDIQKYQSHIDKLYNDIRQYQDYIDKCHKDLRQDRIEFDKYTKEIKGYRMQFDINDGNRKKYEDKINKLENEIKKLKEENIKLKKEPGSPKVASKKPVEMAVSAK